MKVHKALFAGSFNPFHKGHLHIAEKAAKLFDFLYLCVTINPDKNAKVDFEKAQTMIKKQVAHLQNVAVIINKTKLTADLARELGVNYLIRSARDHVDFNYELELAHGNKSMNKELETILIFPDRDDLKYKSTLIRHQKYFQDHKK